MRSVLLLLALVFAAPASAQLSAELAFPGLPPFDSPVGLGHDPVDPGLLYVVEQGGVIRVFVNDPDVTEASSFLDIDARVSSGGETGLLGLAFHPDYAENGLFYVSYTAGSPLRSRVSQFSLGEPDVYPPIANPDSEVILLEIAQPFSNHNGGGLAFGPDGYLYASFGDGGSGGDPEENGQDDTTLLGAILRLDVDGGGTAPDCGGPEANYTVPPNDLADGPGGSCDEIYAWGLRNPWRFSFDRDTGAGWIADVGQNQWEEVDRMANGGNYGWNTYEGDVCFDGPCDPDTDAVIFPVWVYNHSLGCSITGGYVYRGSEVPELAGRYVYGDYCSGRIWALTDIGLGEFENDVQSRRRHHSATSRRSARTPLASSTSSARTAGCIASSRRRTRRTAKACRSVGPGCGWRGRTRSARRRPWRSSSPRPARPGSPSTTCSGARWPCSTTGRRRRRRRCGSRRARSRPASTSSAWRPAGRSRR